MSESNPSPSEDEPEFNGLPDGVIPPEFHFSEDMLRDLQQHMKSMLSFTRDVPSHGEGIWNDQPNPALKVGGLFSVLGSLNDTYQIAKVLAFDKGGAHIKLYGNLWTQRPTAVAPELLEVAPMLGPKEDRDNVMWPISAGHLAFSHASFNALEPVFIIQEDVQESELEGYRMWQDFGGRYF